MKATRRDIEFYQENMDRLQSEKAAETARANAMTNELSLLRRQHEEDVERFKELMAEIRNLREDIACRDKRDREREKMISSLTSRIEELVMKLADAQNQTAINRSKRFARTSEQAALLNRRCPKDREQGKDDFDGNPGAGATVASDTSETKRDGKSLRKPRGKSQYTEPDPCACQKVVYHALDEYFRLPDGARVMMRDGKPDVSRFYYIETQPAKAVCHIYESVRYMTADNETFSSSLPEEVKGMTPVAGCPLTAEGLATIIMYRFGLHLPQYRVKQALRQMGLNLGTSVLDRYYRMAEDELMLKLEGLLHREVLQTPYLMIDETCVLVGVSDRETKARAYMKRYVWAFFNKEKSLVEYVYEEGSRSREVLRRFFKVAENLNIAVTADGYSAYNLFGSEEYPGVLRCGCLTHARRNYVDSLASSHDASLAMIEEIEALFMAERVAVLFGEKERLAWRQREEKPILARIKALAESYRADASLMADSLLAKAVNYMLNQWPTYENIMKSGLPEVSNNLCEQRMKPLKLSMKNSQNIGSEDAAKGHCFIHSLLESCRRLGVSIYDYLVALFRRLPHTPKDQRRQLLPHILGPTIPKQEMIPIFNRSCL